MAEDIQTLTVGDKYFIEQRDVILQEVNEIMDSILNQLNGLNTVSYTHLDVYKRQFIYNI